MQSPIYPIDMQPEIDLRTARLQKLMKEANMDAILVSSNANLYYTSLRFFRGYVYIPQEGDPIFFVIRPVNLEGKNVVYIRKPEQMAEHVAKMPANLGLELDTLTVTEFNRLDKVFPGHETSNASPLLRRSRMVKTPWEIEKMRQDGMHQTAAYRKIAGLYREGMTDVEFQIEIERILRLEGSLGFYRTSGNLMEIFMGSLVNGENADVPSPYDFTMGGAGIDASFPVGANGSLMKPGTTVMVDMNGAFNGYQTDISRVWSIGLLRDEIAKKAHECSRKILRELESLAKPGVPVANLYHRAVEIAQADGLERYFMGYSQQVAFIGHGVGIELNEPPVVMARSRDILEENMTIALEPKFVIPHIGAVGVENTYRVTSAGLENLTPFPEEIVQL